MKADVYLEFLRDQVAKSALNLENAKKTNSKKLIVCEMETAWVVWFRALAEYRSFRRKK